MRGDWGVAAPVVGKRPKWARPARPPFGRAPQTPEHEGCGLARHRASYPDDKDIDEAHAAVEAGHLRQQDLEMTWATGQSILDELDQWPAVIGDWRSFTAPDQWGALGLPQNWSRWGTVWQITLGASNLSWCHADSSAGADVVASAPLTNLYLFVWGRLRADTVTGAADLLARWTAATAL
jgi:hypothetical protein